MSVRFRETTISKSLLPKDVFRQDNVERADLAIVMGSPDPDHLRHRISAGIALFTAGRVPRLLLTGDGREKHPEQKSEAVRMQEIAIKSRVPAGVIITEDTARDAVESAKECTRLLKNEVTLQAVKSVFLVSSAWHLQRMFIVMRRYLPNKISICCHPSSEGVTGTTWQMTPQGRAIVENELRLIEKLLKTGFSLR